MGTSTDGEISFGILFAEGYEFPWDSEEFGCDVDEWWLIETGWKWEGDQPFNSDGEYSPGFSQDDPRIDAYFDSKSDWKKEHPLPFEVINYQSSEAPAYILAIPSSHLTAHRGYPEAFTPSDLRANPTELRALVEFCEKV